MNPAINPATAGAAHLFEIGARDAWEEGDKVLKFFVHTPHFEQLSQPDCCFVFGRKGAGKSALAIASQHLSDWKFRHVIPGEQHEYGAYLGLVKGLEARQNAGLGIDIRQFVELLWSYVVRVLVLQVLLEQATLRDDEDQEALAAIEEYLGNHGLRDKRIGLLLYHLHTRAIQQVPDGAKDGSPALGFLLERLHDRHLDSCLAHARKLLRAGPLLIVIDSLESYEIHNPATKQALCGIIAALMAFAREKPLPGVGIRLLLPAEIHHELIDANPAKFYGKSLFLQWSAGDLFLFLATRYLALLAEHELIPQAKATELQEFLSQTDRDHSGKVLRREFWYRHRFLPERIENALGMEEDTLAFLLRHTQRRPRQLIILFNSVIAEAVRRDELPCISRRSVVEGVHRPNTLSLLLEDTLSPFASQVDALVVRARAAFAQRSRVMTGQSLKHFAKAINDLYGLVYLSNEDALSFLLRAGVIGWIPNLPEERGKRRGYCIAQFEYLMRDRIPLRNDGYYFVHPILGDSFDMLRNEEFGVVYPKPMDDSELEQDLGIALP